MDYTVNNVGNKKAIFLEYIEFGCKYCLRVMQFTRVMKVR
nr:MAG TPA: Thiol:disulfide interchange protein folding protein, virulence factor [Caudoviricetes sp.]